MENFCEEPTPIEIFIKFIKLFFEKSTIFCDLNAFLLQQKNRQTRVSFNTISSKSFVFVMVQLQHFTLSLEETRFKSLGNFSPK